MYARMSASAFSFFRGSNHLYWQDLYRDWHFSLFGGVTETQTWLQGDAHLHNFGACGSHDEQVRFGLDDFDDGIIGDYQYDLWRLLTSVVLAVRERSPFKADYPTEKLHKPKHWRHLASAWGRILAASHLRGARALSTGGADMFARAVLPRTLPRAEAFAELLLNMAQAYTDCVQNDYQVFCRFQSR